MQKLLTAYVELISVVILLRSLSRATESFSSGCSKIRLASWHELARRRKSGWWRRQHFLAAALAQVDATQSTLK